MYRVSGLTKKSKYNVSVVALYDDIATSAVKKTFTITALPASYVSLGAGQTGGVSLYTVSGDSFTSLTKRTGNAYTVCLGGSSLNMGAYYAGTDTLTWTSSNKKVATIKATPGTFTATFTAVGRGYTTIEVKSKVTKAVIARYSIYVNAIGNAYEYYGSIFFESVSLIVICSLHSQCRYTASWPLLVAAACHS